MIYICIPAYNEAGTVGVLLWKIRQVMADFPRDYCLLVLNDGSSDGTDEVLVPYARVLPLSVLHHRERKGYAASLERLLREASAKSTHPMRDVVVVLQADFTEAPEDIPALVKRVEGGADVVGATVRWGAGEVPKSRRWTHAGMSWLLRRTYSSDAIGDPLSGFRAYRVAVLALALEQAQGSPLLSRDGSAANVELLLAVAPHARKTEAADVTARYELRQRPTRYRSWNTIVDLWDVARRSRRVPRAASPLET